jgi:hypothetical protein
MEVLMRIGASDDMYAPESIELLTKSGINFKRHEEYGITVEAFGELLISSGLVLLDEVQWVSFHSCVLSSSPSCCKGLMERCRGYDFGYLLKIVSCAALPPTEAEFFELLRIWFPCIWDIKVSLSPYPHEPHLTTSSTVLDEELQNPERRTARSSRRPPSSSLPPTLPDLTNPICRSRG